MKLVIKNIFNNPLPGSTDLFQKISYSIVAVIVASILFSLIQKNFVFYIEITDLQICKQCHHVSKFIATLTIKKKNSFSVQLSLYIKFWSDDTVFYSSQIFSHYSNNSLRCSTVIFFKFLIMIFLTTMFFLL